MTGFSRWNHASRLILPVFLLIGPALAMAAAPIDQAERDVRIRFEWRGARPETWAGDLEMSQGSLANPVSLSAGSSQAGSLWGDGQSLSFARHDPRRTDGFDVTIRAPQSARMCFTLQTEPGGHSRRQFIFNLADITRHSIVFALGASGGQLSVRRAPGDELRVSIDRPHLIYQSAELFKAVLMPDPSSTATTGTSAKVEWEIRNSLVGRLVSKGSVHLPQSACGTGRPRLPIEFPLPKEEGTFDLRFRLHQNVSDALESVVQVVVLADRAPARAEQVHAEVVADRFRLDDTASNRLPAILPTAGSSNAERLVGLCLDTPGSLANFSGPATPGDLRRDVKTWDAFCVGAQRATEYLRASSGNCLMLPVLAEGSTIYPSEFVERSVRYDSGLLSSTGRDPIQKDVVELLYRLFDRGGFVMIPELQFSGRLAALERQLASDESVARGIELVGPDGRTCREAYGSNGGVAPCYNPLDPRVQNAVLDVVREFVARYHSHPSFRGIAIALDPRNSLQLPGVEWGCDEVTLTRFQRETGVPVDGCTQFVKEVLNGEARPKWIAWRCGELARFYRRIAGALNASAPSAQMILVSTQTRQSASECQAQGLDISLLRSTPHLIVMPYSSSGSFSIELDRTSPRDSVEEAVAPDGKTRR